jgi:hypothetical protein
MAASVWWEEVIAYFCEPPVSDMFVGKTCFDGKGFECIDYIDRHFHPSGAIDALGYIFDLIDIKQKDNKPVFPSKCISPSPSLLSNWGASPLIQLYRLVSCFTPFWVFTTRWFRSFALATIPYMKQAFRQLWTDVLILTRTRS